MLERIDEWHHRHYPKIGTPQPGWKLPLWRAWHLAWRPLCNYVEKRYLIADDYKQAKAQQRSFIWQPTETSANTVATVQWKDVD